MANLASQICLFLKKTPCFISHHKNRVLIFDQMNVLELHAWYPFYCHHNGVYRSRFLTSLGDLFAFLFILKVEFI